MSKGFEAIERKKLKFYLAWLYISYKPDFSLLHDGLDVGQTIIQNYVMRIRIHNGKIILSGWIDKISQMTRLSMIDDRINHMANL